MANNLSKLGDYSYDESLGIYVCPDKTGIQYADGGEDYIKEVLCHARDVSSSSQELNERIKDWPSRYHLSTDRANVLKGIAELFDKDSTVLEIGSGCGAITRWLGENFKSVDALEGSIERAVATRERVRGLNNVRVYFGNALTTAPEKKYDIITLIGVLEYIPGFAPGSPGREAACADLLNKLSKSLTDKGVLVVAIENKLGIKYFSGCAEDHTGRLFDGLIGYPDKTPVTFSRNELESIISTAGFESIQFYHPFPDYKLANTIIRESDEVLSLNPYNWIHTPFEAYSENRVFLWPEGLVLKTICDAGLLWEMSNSFLVIASRSSRNLSLPWLIKKFHTQWQHKRDFWHEILLVPFASGYLIQRYAYNQSYVETSGVTFTMENAPYIRGEQLNYSYISALQMNDPAVSRGSVLRTLYDRLIEIYSSGKHDESGYPLVKGEAIDFTFWNLIADSEKCLHFIDRKWKMREELPADYVLFRNLYYIYNSAILFIPDKSRERFITEQIRAIFPEFTRERLYSHLKAESRFQSVVAGKIVNLDLRDCPMLTVTEQIRSLNEQLRERDALLIALTEREARKSRELDDIHQSLTWRSLGRYQRLIEKVCPPGTGRRKCYDMGLKSGRIVAGEGFGSLWEKYNERKRVKKYERDLAKRTADERPVLETGKPLSCDPFELPNPGEKPEVSIVIPVHNKIDYTYRCLKSISVNTAGSYEVIVIDDASTDNTPDVLGKIINLRVATNETNLGFVGSCNKGGKASHGKYVLFLNNDTIVQKDWLGPMVRMIEQNGAGAAGAKLVYPDGKLQEAGGIIWNDGSGSNYGRGDDPSKPEYNFVREADYCSGAALLVRKDLFDALGGFDERFKPGYYEDTDLCFAIRKMGYKVVYQPRSVIVHYEGVTSGTDMNSGMKKYQEINRSKFFEKWQMVLKADHYPPDAVRYLQDARNRGARKNVLVIDHYVPTCDKDSGSLRMYNLLRILKELGCAVTFIGDNPAKLEPYTAALQQHGVEVIYSPFASSVAGYLATHGKYFDVVIISRAHIAVNHVNNVRKFCEKAVKIFDTVDLQYLREMRRYEIVKDPDVLAEAEKCKAMEYRIMRLCDRTWVVSPYEKELISRENPGIAVDVVSNIHEIHPVNRLFSERKDLLFIGGFIHKPNADAVEWFVKEVFPLIHARNPDIKLYVIGSEPPASIVSLASSHVIITGFVKDPSAYFENCRLSIAPLRYGAGVKGKINQSMSYGLPVVTTSIGAEGMGLVHGTDALIADSPDEFADAVLQVYDDGALWEKLSRGGMENLVRYYSFETIKGIVDKVLQ